MQARITFRSGFETEANVRHGVAVIGTIGAVRLHADGRVTPENDHLFTSGSWERVQVPADACSDCGATSVTNHSRRCRNQLQEN